MSLTFAIVVLAVLAAWGLGSWAILRWGPGQKTMKVWCSLHKKEARIVAIQKDAKFVPSYAGLEVFDVKRCSLFKKGVPVNCGKECLGRP